MKCIECKRNNIPEPRFAAMDKLIPRDKNTKGSYDDICGSCLDNLDIPVKIQKVKRKCRVCKVLLPIDRYFTCLEHDPKLEDPGIYVYC